MGAKDLLASPEELHPALWRASQLARSSTKCIGTGYMALSNQLAGGGWPTGTLIDLLLQQHGIGEMRLLAPALVKAAKKRVIMVQPPHPPQALALAGMGLASSDLVWIKSGNSADALWATEQVLRSGSCGAVLFWATHIRAESLRRLHLAAQAGETLFFVLRPLAAAQDSSPSPLRLTLRAAKDGVEIGFLKRRGPQRDEPLFLPLTMPANAAARRRDQGDPRRETVPARSPARHERALEETLAVEGGRQEARRAGVGTA